MKKVNVILIIGLILVLVGCDKKQNDNFNAKVVGVGLDCGDAYLIRFYDNVENVPNNDTENVFYAINLPDEYKKKDLEINIIKFREPTANEMMNCMTQGITYPQIYIEDIQ